MDFQFSDEQKMIAETAKAFFSEHATSARTRAAMAGDGIDRALWASFCTELGLAGVGVAEHWHVHHLGANMPGDELVRFCAEHEVDVAVLSLTNPEVSTLAEELFLLQTCGDDRSVAETYVMGRPMKSGLV